MSEELFEIKRRCCGMPEPDHTLDRMRELAGLKEDIASYNLTEKYNKFNGLYFGGSLPEIPVTWAKLSKVGGVAKCKIAWNGPEPSKRMLRIGYGWKNAYPVPGSIVINISSVYQRDEAGLDGILIHEMIHVHMFVNGNMNEEHGVKFKAEAAQIGTKSGLTIPLTDDTSNLILTTTKLKTIVVIAYPRGGKTGFGIISLKAYQANPDQITESLQKSVNQGRFPSLKIYEITTPIWTKVATEIPVQRSFSKAYLADEEWVTDLITNGKVLADITKR